MERKKKTIVVVDDKESIREMVGEMLKMFGYTPVLCANGEESVQYLDEADILITDFDMPGMDGIKLAEKAKVKNPRLPVIIMTGRAWDLPANHPADAVIAKPFKIQRLQEVLKEATS